MRPIKLIISAFGTYAGLMPEIDFTKFEEKGLFLITGNTGSGKTTIFDAICFALYGKASGSYRDEKNLRSEYADSSVESYVDFYFTHQGKEYHIKRHPSYDRPKRGGGIKNEPEKVIFYAEGEAPIEGIRNVNEMVKKLLNIDDVQFKQIAMIAQGEFWGLLNAKTEQRTAILRNIFRTGSYKEIEKKLFDRQKDLSTEKYSAENSIFQYLNDIHAAEESEYENELNAIREKVNTAAGAWSIDEFKAIAENIAEEDNKALQSQSEELNKAENELKEKDKELTLAETNNKIIERAKKLILENESLAKKKGEMAELEAKVGRQKKATNIVKPKIDEWEKDKKKAADTKAKIEKGKENLERFNESLKKASDEYQKAESEKGNAEELAQNTKENERVLSELKVKITEISKNEAKEFSVKKVALETAQKSAGEAQTAYDDALRERAEAEKLFDACRAGMLAQYLEEGRKCPVCGSTHHPEPAQLPETTVTEEKLEKLKKNEIKIQGEKEKAVAAAEKAKGEFETTDSNLKKLILECLKNPIINAENRIADGQKNLEILEELKASVDSKWLESKKNMDAAEEELRNINKAIETSTNAKETAKNAVTETEATLKMLEETLKGIEEEIKSREKELETIISENGFSSLKEVEAYFAGKDEIGLSEEKISAYNKSLIENEANLKQAKEDAAGKTLIDITALTTERDNRNIQVESIRKKINSIDNRKKTNEKYLKEIEAKSENLVEIQHKYAICHKMYELVKGTTGTGRITLEQYVQASGFDGIIAAANKRLSMMTGGQFELFRKDDVLSRRENTFLDLEVLDNFTGYRRPVANLSGGESFKASLSLALGLSDTVSSNLGGVQMDALFIDEGFGTLDAHSLESTMEVLNNLSGKNKLVGVISHRDEMKDSINQQIVVTKTNKGSSFAIETGE